ncbi:glycosyltransferase [Polaribacter aestuariivivens]|uniref:Glycosyltransferase n=1 Tax=Polaribacter aestuariivivens TaxID=2304626 RepID=A0A5S3N7Q5_9FLAO|nr:glycosyltransferase [Polaribacter aestuariivivens]TMM31350.1 glycosyltransferase [Polaribacter aestuariivivens]
MTIDLSVIILSKTNSNTIFETTMNCINSLVASEESIKGIEIILVESNKNYAKTYAYPDFVKVIIPEEQFGFHKFLNIGIKASSGKFIALCNNDLIFEKNWYSEILKVANTHKEIDSFSPIDPREELNKYKGTYEIGYKIRSQIKGWCIVCKRKMLHKINLLDEKFVFYYSDNDYSLTLLYYNIKHAVVSKSHVKHLHKVSTKEAIKNKDLFFNENVTNKKLPKHLKLPAYKEILTSNRGLKDHLIYYEKWGNPDSVYRIARYAKKLNSLHLNIITKLLFLTKRVFKI